MTDTFFSSTTGKEVKKPNSWETLTEVNTSHWTDYHMTHFKLFPLKFTLGLCFEKQPVAVFGTNHQLTLD